MSRRMRPALPGRRLGDLERYGLLALGAGLLLGVGVLTEQWERQKAERVAQGHPIAVAAGWEWSTPAHPDDAEPGEPAPIPGGGTGGEARAPVAPRHFDFFEPPVRLPGTAPADVPPPPEAMPGAAATVTVQKGDTLSAIAARHLGSAAEWRRLLQANPGIDSRALQEGQLLRLPGPTAARRTAAAGKSDRTYEIQRNDTLEGISLRFYGDRTRWTDILDANRDRIMSPERLQVGVRIRIPR